VPKGPYSVRSGHDGALIDNLSFHNPSTYLDFFKRFACKECATEGVMDDMKGTAAETTEPDHHTSCLDKVCCALCAGMEILHENTMELNYHSNFPENWNMRESKEQAKQCR
jgi:hypothetical protein